LPIRLRIELFQFARFNDGFYTCGDAAHNRVYYLLIRSRWHPIHSGSPRAYFSGYNFMNPQ